MPTSFRTGSSPASRRQETSCPARLSRLSATRMVCPLGRDNPWLRRGESKSGMEIFTSVPSPSALSTTICPPMLSTKFLTMDIPSPVPSMRLMAAFWTRSKGRKMRSRNSLLMPMPLSRQEKSTRTESGLTSGCWENEIWISPPSGVYFTALLIIFTKI